MCRAWCHRSWVLWTEIIPLLLLCILQRPTKHVILHIQTKTDTKLQCSLHVQFCTTERRKHWCICLVHKSICCILWTYPVCTHGNPIQAPCVLAKNANTIVWFLQGTFVVNDGCLWSYCTSAWDPLWLTVPAENTNLTKAEERAVSRVPWRPETICEGMMEGALPSFTVIARGNVSAGMSGTTFLLCSYIHVPYALAPIVHTIPLSGYRHGSRGCCATTPEHSLGHNKNI